MVQRTEAESRVALKDGRSVTIRQLMEQDHVALINFGLGLPKNDLLYLEDDFQNPEIISRMIHANAAENWWQIVAVTDDGSIVAYTSALRMPGWSYHVANIRLIVDRAWRRSGLGMAMAQAIVDVAHDIGAGKVMVEMLTAQTAGQAIFGRLGFAVEGQLARHAIDRDGNLHDIVLMSAFIRR
ncbi:GCN5-related N-acetyltransferase [Oscillochloris trichoides DG-6]|uniref:GCN5-related N-acetyltransferase n=1 Tax=Oscillochloris trichoides DG-6 TaxID=765420 RepID=E1IBS5_9CHLR|nr:GNAT family N-acetyltransferase [Oscillochloris trichoides]EFO81377.1 GCN5-related N-acetyltransferase [Oscillochloris trichoides DG-6]